MRVCPRCGRAYDKGDNNLPRRRSRDHILPIMRGGADRIHGDTRNLETMCQQCNSLRADCGHCWGVVAAVRAVAETEGVNARVVMAWWNVRRIASVELRAADDRRRKVAECVRMGRILVRSDLDEFIWPADTAAKQVWNLATLARNGG